MSNEQPEDEWVRTVKSGARLILPPGLLDTTTLSGKLIDVLRRGNQERPAYTWWARELGRLVGEAKRSEQLVSNIGILSFVAGFAMGVAVALMYGG